MTTESSLFERIPNSIKIATACLALIPALINSLHDVYVAALNLPRTDEEAVNLKLFTEYSGKEALDRKIINIINHDESVPVVFEVYSKGDIKIQYKDTVKWLPFPSEEKKKVAFSWISSAIAQTPAPAPSIPGRNRQDFIEGGKLKQSFLSLDGKKQISQTIEMRTGKVLEYSERPATPGDIKAFKIGSDFASERKSAEKSIRIELAR